MRRVHKEPAGSPTAADSWGDEKKWEAWDDDERKKKAQKPATTVTAIDVEAEALLPSAVAKQSNIFVRIIACLCAWTICLPLKLCKSKKGAVALVLIVAGLIGGYIYTSVPLCSCGCAPSMPMGPNNKPWEWGKTGGGKDVVVWMDVENELPSEADALTGDTGSSSSGVWGWLSSVFSTKPVKKDKSESKKATPPSGADRIVFTPGQLRKKCGKDFWSHYPEGPLPSECPMSYNQNRNEVKRICTRDCEALCRMKGGMWMDGPEE
eukprot:tig00000189_g14346.t1